MPNVSGSLWKNRDFKLFLTIQTLSSLGDSFSYVALPLLVLHATGSVVQMGMVTALQGAASILTGLFAGVVVDRVDRRLLLLVCDVARGVLYALIPLAWMFSPQLWVIYTVVPVAGAFAMLFRVGYVAMTPSLVERDQITEANGRLYGSFAVASVIGPVVAGVVCAAVGPQVAIGVDAASFVVSALGVLLVRTRERAQEHDDEQVAEQPPTSRRKALLAEFLAGARFLWDHPIMRPLTVLLSVLTFLNYGITDLIVFYLKDSLGHSDSTVGYVLAVATIGTMVASSLVARIRRRIGFGATWIGANVLCGAAIACLGLSASVPVIAALSCVMLASTGVGGISSMSLRQEVTPDKLLGRVTSAFWTIHSALGPLGAGLLTAAASAYGVKAVCLLIGVGSLLTALYGLRTALWRTAPERPLTEGV
ncbi:MFS transporter [Kitasatospora sp. NPDC051170]|uniref:MFS transporter n=1 Tax=Kitasatospora sp. NPDC051170 TaxID=3364056 RepID=UPI0037A8AAC5